MSTALKRLIEEQNEIWTRMQDLRRGMEDRDLTAEERANWDAAEARLTEVSGDIERLQRADRLEQVDRSQIIIGGQPHNDGPDERGELSDEQRYAEVFGIYLRRGMSALDLAGQELLSAGFQAGERRVAQATQDDSLGGYLVPDEFRNKLTETMKTYGGLLQIANVITTSTGADLAWPANDDTGNEGEFLPENTQVNEQNFTFSQRKLGAYTVNSKMVRVPIQLLQDSAFDLDSWLPRKLGERIGRRMARAFTTGTGVEQPEGITTSVAVGATGTGTISSGGAFAYPDLVDLEHAIDPAYRSTARYLLHDTALKHVRKMKDTQNRPLWIPVPAPGFPSTINGYEYTIDNSMPAVATNSKSVAFGDFKAGYVIRLVRGIQALRLTERYADFLQVGFLSFARVDGKVDDPGALRVLASPAS